ncbi:MAG: hypothetical protein V1899_04435 [Planctomycetota bacterium]
MESDYAQIVEKTIKAIDDFGEREAIRKAIQGNLESATEIRNGPWRFVKTILTASPQKELKSQQDVALPKGTDRAHVSDDDISRLIAQALAAYKRISDAFAAQEYEKSVPWVLKGKKPCFPEEMTRNEENIKTMAKTFNQESAPANRDVTAGLVKDLKAQGLVLGPAEVEIVSASKYTELERGSGQYGSITNKSTTTVRIPCPGSMLIGQKYVAGALSPRCQSMTQDKELVILMLKIGDDWFWEPFGW